MELKPNQFFNVKTKDGMLRCMLKCTAIDDTKITTSSVYGVIEILHTDILSLNILDTIRICPICGNQVFSFHTYAGDVCPTCHNKSIKQPSKRQEKVSQQSQPIDWTKIKIEVK